MSGTIPIPTTRAPGLLARQRLVQQMQSDQLDLFRLQNQISTGRRINLPSDDAPAALRAITLQRLLERKGQIASNVETGQSFLAATDSALNDVASILGGVRGDALGVAGTASTQEERDVVAETVDRALTQLVTTGNRQFRGRYLFAGSQTDQTPYELKDDLVEYLGNDQRIQNYSDVDVLFSTNSSGSEVFGGFSAQVVGSADLNPQLTVDTPLSSLREGRGISPNGSILVSDGSNSSLVDLSNASTVGDVVRQIEANPPKNRQVSASIVEGRLSVQLDSLGGGNLTITEQGGGKSAEELGILEETGVGVSPLVGRDLNPILLKTTPLDSLLGSKASTRLTSAGGNNDLIVQAANNGAQFNGASIQIVDDNLLAASPGVAKGDEFAEFDPSARAASASLRFSGPGNDLIVSASTPGDAYNNAKIFVTGQTGLGDAALANYDSVTNRLTITIDDAGATSVQEVINAIGGTGEFTAAHDNSIEATYNPAATIDAGDIANVIGDTGNSGGNANTLYVHIAEDASTANHVASAINAEGTFTARVDQLDTTILAAAGSGYVSTSAAAVAAGGGGETLDLASGVQVVNGENRFTLDFSNAETVEDLLNVFNREETGLRAELNAEGNGLNVSTRLSGGDFQIGENGGTTAAQLGIRSLTESTKLNQLNYGVGVPEKQGNDFTITSQDAGGLDVALDFDVAGATTLGDVVDLINNHPANNTGGVALKAQLAATGNGIEIIDENSTGTGEITVATEFGSEAAEYLGLVDGDTGQRSSTTGTLTGDDRHYLETDSVFTTLVRLRDALKGGDIPAIGRAINKIDGDIDRVTSARAEVGAREQGLQITQQNLQDENVQLRSALSDDLDVDLVEAISQLTARQTSLQASLQTTANLLQMSLLNYL